MKELIEIQQALKAPKSNYNSFGEYNYRSCEDILEAVKPLCAARGLLLTLSDEVVNMGDRYYIRATAKLCKDGAEISVTAFAREAMDKKGMDDSQITGTASSYARKYALNGLFLIDDTKDADTDEYKNNAKTAEQLKATEAQIDQIQRGCKAAGQDVADILKKYNVEYLNGLTNAQADAVVRKLVEMVKK